MCIHSGSVGRVAVFYIIIYMSGVEMMESELKLSLYSLCTSTINVYGFVCTPVYIHFTHFVITKWVAWARGGLNRKWNWSDKKEIRFAGDTVKLCQEKFYVKKNYWVLRFRWFVLYTALYNSDGIFWF